MLVIGRKRGERIRLTVAGNIIWITVKEIDRNKCRIGISAPEEVKIMREELIQATKDVEARG